MLVRHKINKMALPIRLALFRLASSVLWLYANFPKKGGRFGRVRVARQFLPPSDWLSLVSGNVNTRDAKILMSNFKPLWKGFFMSLCHHDVFWAYSAQNIARILPDTRGITT